MTALQVCRKLSMRRWKSSGSRRSANSALGYREHVRFEERLVHRRGTLWDSIVSPIRRIANRRSE